MLWSLSNTWPPASLYLAILGKAVHVICTHPVNPPACTHDLIHGKLIDIHYHAQVLCPPHTVDTCMQSHVSISCQPTCLQAWSHTWKLYSYVLIHLRFVNTVVAWVSKQSAVKHFSEANKLSYSRNLLFSRVASSVTLAVHHLCGLEWVCMYFTSDLTQLDFSSS